METEIPQENENEDPADSEINWDNRILCSDGNCIGVIGADGRCKECGKKYEGPLPVTSAVEQEDQVVDEHEEMPAAADKSNLEQEDQAVDKDEEMPAAADETSRVEESAMDEDWENRVLCRDGNCIGIIGPDGRCKECGKPYK
jgi:hypothetical protein